MPPPTHPWLPKAIALPRFAGTQRRLPARYYQQIIYFLLKNRSPTTQWLKNCRRTWWRKRVTWVSAGRAALKRPRGDGRARTHRLDLHPGWWCRSGQRESRPRPGKPSLQPGGGTQKQLWPQNARISDCPLGPQKNLLEAQNTRSWKVFCCRATPANRGCTSTVLCTADVFARTFLRLPVSYTLSWKQTLQGWQNSPWWPDPSAL